MKKSNLLIGAVISGLVAGSVVRLTKTQADDPHGKAKAEGKENSCKGNSCKGNSCKGKKGKKGDKKDAKDAKKKDDKAAAPADTTTPPAEGTTPPAGE